jgi:hypothetical protein
MANSIVLQTRSVVHPFDVAPVTWHCITIWSTLLLATWRIFIVGRTISIFIEQYNLPYFNTMPRRRGELHTLFVSNRVDHIVMQCHVTGATSKGWTTLIVHNVNDIQLFERTRCKIILNYTCILPRLNGMW